MLNRLGLVYFKLLCVTAIYGGHFAAGRYLSAHVPHFTGGALRYGVAVATLAVMLSFSRSGWPRIAARDWGAMLVLGATGVFIFNALFFLSLQYIEAGRSSLISSVAWVLTPLGAWAVFGSRMTWLQLLGAAIAMAGVGIVVSRGDAASLLAGALGPGELASFAGSLAWVVFTLTGRSVMRRVSPMTAVTYSSLAGTAMLFVAAALEHPWSRIAALPAAGWMAVVYLGVVGTALTSLWFLEGVQRIGPTRATVFMNFVPVFSVLFGWLLLGEPLLPSLVIGGALVLAGIVVVNRPAKREGG